MTGTWLAAGSAAAAPLAAHRAAVPTAMQGFTPGGPMVRTAAAGRSAAAAGGSNAAVQSLNWSGYAASGANGAFTSVSATWTQPTATCPSATAQYASFWAGLDGYSSTSVEQTGTDSDCNGTTPVYYGWYEMYPAAPVTFSNKIKPGDHLSASVTFSGTSTYTLVLKDSTRGWTHTITKNESGLDRSSAEVITEAPSSTTGVLPLANFSTVKYTGVDANGSSLAGQSPTEIVIAGASGDPEDSTSAISSAGAFSNTWLTSG